MNSKSSSSAVPRTLEMYISLDLIKQFIEEKIQQFGFEAGEHIVSIDMPGVPQTIPMKIKFQKERGVKIITNNG